MALAMGILAIIIGYFLGSVPFAYVVARLVKSVDIRQVGGGNMGAANVMREVGIVAGLTVLLLDMAKGLLAVVIARWLDVSMIFVFMAGFAVVAGHIWPVFLGFKGGGGAAATLGVLSVLAPREFAISFTIILLIVLLTRNFGFAIGVGLIPLPLLIWGFGGESSLIIYAVALPLLCFFRNTRSVVTFARNLAAARSKRDLIVDRQFMPWRRKGKG